MKILHGADFHLGLRRFGTETPTGNTRIDDFAATLTRFVDTAIEQDVDLAIIAGDTFETRFPGPQELAILSRAVRRMRERIPIIIVPGNHDGMATIGDPDTHTLNWLADLDLEGATVLTHPAIYRGDGFDVHALPYPHKRSLDEELRAQGPEQRVEEASGRVEALIAEMAGQRALDRPTIFVGHLSVLHAQIGSERRMKFSWDVTVRPEVFAPYDYVALGHIHRQQKVSANTWYAGAPDYQDFDEMGQTKGFLLASVGPGLGPLVTSIPSHPRPLGVLDLTQAPDGMIEGYGTPDWYATGPIIKAIVHATVRRPTAGDLVALRRQLLALGASTVLTEVVDERIPIEQPQELATPDDASDTAPYPRSLAPAPAAPTITAASPQDALRTWLAGRGHPPTHPAVALGDELIAAAIAGGAP